MLWGGKELFEVLGSKIGGTGNHEISILYNRLRTELINKKVTNSDMVPCTLTNKPHVINH